jgi:hypothetical protein
MKKLYLLLLCIPFLNGCAAISSTEKINISMSNCPTLKRYTREQMANAASELKSLSNNSQIGAMITDYSKLRDACRSVER